MIERSRVRGPARGRENVLLHGQLSVQALSSLSVPLVNRFGLAARRQPVLNWANVCSPEHTSDTWTNYDSFLN